MARSAVAFLSTENLLHNVNVVRSQVGKAKIIAMVKANAYGHGIRSVGQRLQDYVDLMGVASIDEALALRKAGVMTPIILMQGVFESKELYEASEYNFHIVLTHHQQLAWLLNQQFANPLSVWIKVNTGMGRLGFGLSEVEAIFAKLSNHPSVKEPVRILSHFACADEKNHPLNQQQIQKMQRLITQCKTEYSFCNSAAIFHFPTQHCDFVRPGIALYGVSPIPGVNAADLNLKPVMTLRSTLISVSNLNKGDYVGYGARYQCHEPMPIGIVAFGYGDGYPFSAKDGAKVLVGDVLCPLVGRVSMDMLAVDLRLFPEAKVGTPVILWGDSLPVEELACFTNNIPWDILAGVQHRVRFHWSPKI